MAVPCDGRSRCTGFYPSDELPAGGRQGMPQRAPVRNLSSPDFKGYTSRQLFARSSCGERPVDLPIRLPQIPTRSIDGTVRPPEAATFWWVRTVSCPGRKPAISFDRPLVGHAGAGISQGFRRRQGSERQAAPARWRREAGAAHRNRRVCRGTVPGRRGVKQQRTSIGINPSEIGPVAPSSGRQACFRPMLT